MTDYYFRDKEKYPNYKKNYETCAERYGKTLEAISKVVLGIENMTGKQIAEMFDYTPSYISQLKKRISGLKYPPKIVNGRLVCFKCGKVINKTDYFNIHHNHNTGQYIAIVCMSCNMKFSNYEIKYIRDDSDIKIADDIISIKKVDLYRSILKKFIPIFLEKGLEIEFTDKEFEIIKEIYEEIKNA
ncbi:MAG: endonuclease domain-containing protein [Promethearchaeota archaeon]